MTHPGGALWIPSGVLVWAAHFAALYGFTAFACARGSPEALPWLTGAATLAALAALAAIAFIHRGGRGFHAWMTLAVAGLSLVAVVFQTVPLFIVRPCA